MEQTATWWQIIITLAGAFGGLEFVKWLFNRKTNSRLAVAEAERSEFHILQETNEWLQKQLQEKEARFVEQTDLLRKVQRELLYMAKEMSEKEVAHAKDKASLEIELIQVRCNDEECPFRQPPTSKTKPRNGLTKEEYHAQKLLTQ